MNDTLVSDVLGTIVVLTSLVNAAYWMLAL
jgi:hypothetical protein